MCLDGDMATLTPKCQYVLAQDDQGTIHYLVQGSNELGEPVLQEAEPLGGKTDFLHGGDLDMNDPELVDPVNVPGVEMMGGVALTGADMVEGDDGMGEQVMLMNLQHI